jgi:phosphatidylserine/phosphatidylglycerophosphate/cardiolipin synthase-like enzyme
VSTDRLRLALEANLESELAGKRAQCALLAEQEAAIRANDSRALGAAGEKLFAELHRAVDRARARTQLLADLAALLDVAPARVENIAAALGAPGAHLVELRAELRAICADSLARGRRLSALVRVHGGLIEEALGRFLAPDASGQPLGRGSLVDARA